ncbi:MAG: Na+/H+ antiporter subunit E [Candidatus Rokubacteria bacterium]|nr:Na+/H+ antiporter subunit E [Candidatus Rokubacteria bacterium]
MTVAAALLLNVLLALTWAAATGELTLGSLVLGFAVSYAILAFAEPVIGASGYFVKAPRMLRLTALFLWELVVASLRVAHDVATPTHYSRPGVIAVPLEATTEVEITVLANLISLTPGTLSLDVSPDRRVLYIHAMFADDPDAVRRQIKDGFERRLLEVLR